MLDAVVIIVIINMFIVSFHYEVYHLLNNLVLVILLQDIIHLIRYSIIFYVQNILVDEVM